MSNAASHRSLFCVPVLAMFACSSIGCTPDATDLGAGDNLEMSQHALFSALSVPYRGVNLASAEFGPQDPTDFNSGVLPGVYGSNYVYPDGDTEATYFMSKGMNTFRLPFRWERIQRSLSGALDSAELGRLTTVVNAITGKGGYVILDLHNYGRYGNNNNVIGSSAVPNTAFADIWYKLASQFVNNPKVIFEIMNEPYGMISTEAWVVSANAAITAIRNTGAKQLILVQGYHWSGAHAWSSSDVYGTSNAVAMLNIVDPGNNYAYDVHQYLDQSSDITKNFAGLSDQCTSKTIGSQSLKNFTDWLVANQRRGFLTEFAGGRNSTCYAAIKDTVAHMMNNPTVYLGWTYWAAGPRWGEYMFTLEPSNGVDRPQLASLKPYLRDSISMTLTPSMTIDYDDGLSWCATVTLMNPSFFTIGRWNVSIDLGKSKLNGLWYGYVTQNGQVITVTTSPWNYPIAPLGSQRFGLCGSPVGTTTGYLPTISPSATGIVLGT